MAKSIYLSPSTQKNNIGVGNYGTEEERMNQVADVTESVLRQHGIKVYRNKPEMTLAQLVTDSNSKKPDIHFAIHSNAGASGKVRGCEVYCHRFGGNGEKLARAIYAVLEPLTSSGDRGVKEGHSHFGQGKPLYELAKTTAPAVLVEVAFHDNKEDAEWIVNNLEAIGTALANGVLDYYGIQYMLSDQNSEKRTKLYRVQIGAYNMKANAEVQLVKLEAAGFKGYIKHD